MKRLVIVVYCIISLIQTGIAFADTREDYEQAYKLYVAAGTCLAAYSDRYGQMANTYLERDGWKIEKFTHAGDTADARFLLAENQFEDGSTMYVLAFVGTENDKDMKANLKVEKVYFAGNSYEEFAAYAAKPGMPPMVPKVHRGFHEFVQAGLKAGTQDPDGKSRYLADVLVANSDIQVLLVGHSRGGAAAALAGARLISMGVKPEQIEIISFGAPAVGNDAFAASFSPLLNLTRVVISGDPVTGVLQKLVGGYKQFGREVLWEMPSTAHKAHDMATYVDLAIKNYYDKREQAVQEKLITLPGVAAVSEVQAGKVYVAPIKNNLPQPLQQEFRYMKQALFGEYRDVIASYVIAEDTEADQLLKRAADAGCQWLLVPEVSGYRYKEERNVYYITLAQTVYNVETGALVQTAAFSTGTYNLTPLTAFLHVTKSMTYEWQTEKSSQIQ